MKLSTFFRLYIDGFRQMTWGRTLWVIILVKLFIMFAILKVFFFPDLLKTSFKSDGERSEHVSGEFIERMNNGEWGMKNK